MENQKLSVWYDQLIAAIFDPYFYGIIVGLLVFLVLMMLSKLLAPHTHVESKDQSGEPDETLLVSTPSSDKKDSDAAVIKEIKATDKASWLGKLQQGLSKTRNSLQSSMSNLFQGKKIDDTTLESLHETLFRSDIGVATADKLVGHVNSSLKGKNSSWEEVKSELHKAAFDIMSTTRHPLNIPSTGPQVILVVGVNGVGKTTSIGKLAAHFMSEDKTVLLCAADTFRAAAIDQLKVWGERLGTKVIAHQQGSDPAAVAYDGVKAAIARESDVLIIDTAGRLHSKNDLMQELNKIKRVIGKDLPEAPHETWLVIDATTGQNAFQQVKAFDEVAKLTGIIITKLDGTAKGGVIIGISDQFKHPIRYIGVGEKASDLREFNPKDYLDSLFAEA
ncbi:MAG: signal recognition particle-docking protein FtsY [Oligoflexales bacterium]